MGAVPFPLWICTRIISALSLGSWLTLWVVPFTWAVFMVALGSIVFATEYVKLGKRVPDLVGLE
jgi:hypothetical protein